MGRWSQFAGLADDLRKKPFHVLFANPFDVFESVYPKQLQALEKVGLDVRRRPRNFTLHHKTTHPAVDKKGPRMAPGWNSTTQEITTLGQHGCYVVFDKQGDLRFRGRLSFEEVEDLVRELLAER